MAAGRPKTWQLSPHDEWLIRQLKKERKAMRKQIAQLREDLHELEDSAIAEKFELPKYVVTKI